MSSAKYQSVLNLGGQLSMKDTQVKEEDGKLKIAGTVKNQHEKNLIWDEIKKKGGENPSDIEADIKVADSSVFAHHTVQGGETLGKISKKYYGDSSKYNKIFEANRDKLKSADLIHPGDELVIPNI
jgi:nucleoid-associated protein YgaU